MTQQGLAVIGIIIGCLGLGIHFGRAIERAIGKSKSK